MPLKKSPTHETEIAALLFRALEEQNASWIHRALDGSPPAQAARALARFGTWYRGLFLSVVGPSVALRAFRELPVRAQAEILRKMKPTDARRLLSPADFGEMSFFLSLLDERSVERIRGGSSRAIPSDKACEVPG